MWQKLKGIDLAMYILVLTGLGYLVTFLYEWGYKSYFGITMDFIDLSVTTITKSITMIGVFIGIGFFANLFFDDASDLKRSLKKIFFFSVSNKTNKILLQFLCIIGMVGMILGMYATESPLNKTYLAGAIIFSHYYFSLKEYQKLMIISFLALMFLFPFIIGVINATQKEQFYKVEGTDQIVIELVNDKAITARFDEDKRAIYPEYEFIQIESTDKQK